VDQIADGVFSWTAPHPEYRPRAEEVVSYALREHDTLALVDPLLPAAPDVRDSVLDDLDALAAGADRVELLVTIPYHTRSAEELLLRYGNVRPARLWGHANVRKRLNDPGLLTEVPWAGAGEAEEVADGLALAFTIGRPRRSEHPYLFPGLRAVVFGDAVVGTCGGVRFWNQSAGTGAAWYRDVFAPTLAPLAEREVEHVLVTHGPPVLGGGRRALEECLAAPPVDMY
jgi:hypothetical protein